jgi:hypothetical protein
MTVVVGVNMVREPVVVVVVVVATVAVKAGDSTQPVQMQALLRMGNGDSAVVVVMQVICRRNLPRRLRGLPVLDLRRLRRLLKRLLRSRR